MESQQKSEKLTFGDVLQEVAEFRGNEPVRPSDAAAIAAAELRAYGKPGPPDGLGAQAQEAADKNVEAGVVQPSSEGWNVTTEGKEAHTIGEVLQNPKERLSTDKPVTPEAAHYIQQAEAYNAPRGSRPVDITKGGVGSRADSAASRNVHRETQSQT